MAPVVMLRTLRTLVVARDLSFRQRAVTVLVELGPVAFAMTALDDTDEIVALVERQHADVVVLDATGFAWAVPQVMTVLCNVAPHVGIVVVNGGAGDSSRPRSVLPKWGWAADLSEAVLHAHRFGNPLREDITDVHN